MSFVKLTTNTDNKSKCIRFDTSYTHCNIKTSHFDKLQHILGLYDTIDAITLFIDEPPQNWKITRPLDSIKHICLDAHTKFCNRPNVLPENFWLMFPNLETIIVLLVFIPVANLDTLQNLNTFRLIHRYSKIKKHDTKIQEIIQTLANMNTLTDIQIKSMKRCNIPDELFQNNPGLKYIEFDYNTFADNIPSILNCRELLWMSIKIDLLANMYILDLTNLEQFKIKDYVNDTHKIPDEVFSRSIFTTCRTQGMELEPVTDRNNLRGKHYMKLMSDSANKPDRPNPRYIGNGNFGVNSYWYG